LVPRTGNPGVWFPSKKTTKKPVASVYTNCETALADCRTEEVALERSRRGPAVNAISQE
jgi:hypothetical protein